MLQPRTPSDVAPRRRRQPLVVVLTATAAGIVLDRYAAIPPGAQLAAACGGTVLWFFAHRKRCEAWATAALLCSAAAVGGAWHHACWRLFPADDLGCFATVDPQPIVCEAIVVDAPRVVSQLSEYGASEFETKTRFEITVLRLRDGEALRPASGRVDVQVDAALEGVAAGDRVRIVGRVARSSPPLNPGEFDFAAHYRAERKLCLVRVATAAHVEVLEHGAVRGPGTMLAELRRAGHRRLLAVVPQGRAGFASALLLGYRDQLQRRENWRFFRTGTIHILSISGLHVGMLALFLLAALRVGWMRRGTGLTITMLVTLGYVATIDADPPAVRAALMVVLVAVAGLLVRAPLTWNILAASALVVLAMNPADLFRAGPQLSYLAAGVLAWSAGRARTRDEIDPFDRLLTSRRDRVRQALRRFGRSFGRALFVSTAIFVVAAPLVAHRFHIVSPIALVLTPLLALPVAVALLTGFLTLTLGALLPPLGTVLGWICGTSLSVIERLVDWAQSIPGGWFWLPGPTAAQTTLFYLVLGAALVLPLRPRLRQCTALAAIAWGAYAMVPHHTLPADVAVRTTFISVGHGLSVLVEQRDGPTWLYDCGRFGAADRGAQSIAGVLWSRGIRHLDAIVISHTDVDHYNALPVLLEQFRVDRVFVSATTFNSSSSAAASIRQTAAKAGVPIAPLWEGRPWLAGGEADVGVRILHPPEAGLAGNDNVNSLVIELTSHGRRLLLTGDLEGPGLDRLLAKPAIDYDVLLAPHHGSPRSEPQRTASWSTPEWVIVSGAGDRGGTVRGAFETADATVLETTVDGAVTVDILRNGELRVATFCGSR